MSTFPPAGLHTPTLLSTSALLPAAPASPEPFPALMSRIPIFLAGDHSAEGLVCCAAPPCRCPWLVPAQGRSCRHTGRWSLTGGDAALCLSALWMPAPTFQGSAVSAAHVEGDFGGFPSLLQRKPFQLPSEAGGRGPAVPAGVPGS